MKKFVVPNKIRQKCRLRQCLNFVSRNSKSIENKTKLIKVELSESP